MGQVGALFDLDKTLLDASSGQLYARYLYRQGKMGRRDLATVAWWVILSSLGFFEMQKVIPRLLAGAAGGDEQEMRSSCDRWFATDVVPHVTARGRQRVAEHEAQGHVLGIVSGSTQFVVRPMAEYLGFPGQYVCTHLESENGRLTGQTVPPLCYGQGKVVWTERFASDYDVDLSASFFYTDSISDLPLLECVGHPVAVNPDLRLRRLAEKRDWPIQRFY